jgi:hypothetical protein
MAGVADSVEPVIAEIVRKKDQHPRPPLIPDVKDCEAVQHGENGKLHCFREQINGKITDAHGETGCGVLDFIEVAAHDRVGDGLQRYQQHERWNRKDNQVGHLLHKRKSTKAICELPAKTASGHVSEAVRY